MSRFKRRNHQPPDAQTQTGLKPSADSVTGRKNATAHGKMLKTHSASPLTPAPGGRAADSYRPKKRGPGQPPVTILLPPSGEDIPAPLIDLDATIPDFVPPRATRDVIRGLAQHCNSIATLATILGVTEKTMHAIFKRQPEIRALWDKNQHLGISAARGNLFALSKTAPAAAIFIAKNHCGMRDDVGVSGTIDHRHHVLVTLLDEISGRGKQIADASGVAAEANAGKVIEHQADE